MKLTRKNYKECLNKYKHSKLIENNDEIKIIKGDVIFTDDKQKEIYLEQQKNRRIKFRYHSGYLSYATIEDYCYDIGVIVDKTHISGSINEITFKDDM